MRGCEMRYGGDVNVKNMLCSQTTLAQAEHALRQGLIAQKVFEHFCLFADWAAPRFSGSAGIRQDRFYNRFGKEAYWRRIDRVKRLHDRILGV